MNYQYKFDKILTIREKEKDDAFSKYSDAKKKFEEVAEKLYKVLKKKEEMQDFQQSKLQEGLSILEMRHNQVFMDNLEKIINQYQQEVIVARKRMNAQQEVLIEKNIEVKKYEKIKEKDYEKFLEINRIQENNQMDDVSIQTFLSKEN
ncbi:flagellar export protein FliJ [Bacillus massiliigorillae]|uniref:flagellar export protein FliJ n=1 Tax=Bacillus massiliigorillae TaxID=1243664 RepID=UPI0003AA8254|nr:flagellar export protein FliJ [Bacillus massiliigorillae]